MGTRGLLGFIARGRRNATYNHWDSYPTGLGKDIVAFILSLSDEDRATLIRNISEMTWVDSNTKPSLEIQEHYSNLGFSDDKVGGGNLDDWYCLLRHTQGAAMLPVLLNGQLKHSVDAMDFLADGLFCEWAYFIDFENKKLEVWQNTLIAEISFDELKIEGDSFMDRMEKGQGGQ